MSYDAWEHELFGTLRNRPYAAFGLHDCYAHFWLPHLGRLLERLKDTARLTTMGAVAAKTALGCAE
jgi:hypothetical protein